MRFNRRTILDAKGKRWREAGRGRFLDPELSGLRQGGSSPDAAKIEAAYIGFGTMLHNRLKRPDATWRQLATVIDSEELLHRELWLDNIPKMRLWEGDKVLSALRAESLPIVTRPHEASLMIPKGDILNDRFGIYKGRINDLGDAYDWHLMEMVVAMLCAGISGTALGTTYDGQNLIDTDHTALGNGTGAQQSNKITGAFSATVFQNAWNAFLGFVDENGTPYNTMNGRTMYLVHGPANRTAVRTVLQQQWIPSLQQNMDMGMAKPYLVPWIRPATYNVLGAQITLTGNEWFLMPEGSSAVILQRKRMPEFLAVEEGEFTFRTGKYLYGIESEDGAAYGLWQEIVGGPGT